MSIDTPEQQLERRIAELSANDPQFAAAKPSPSVNAAIEQAGAQRGLLMLPQGADLRMAAEARTGGNAVVVQLRDEPAAATIH